MSGSPASRPQLENFAFTPDRRQIVDGRVRVRLPKTGTRRNAITYSKLLTAVTLPARSAFDFVGTLTRPGAWVAEEDLGPGVLLERSEVEGDNRERERRRWVGLYILWRWQDGDWRELARIAGDGELANLAAIASRAIAGAPRLEVAPTVAEAAERIREYLEGEVKRMDPCRREAVLSLVHDQLAARIVDEAA